MPTPNLCISIISRVQKCYVFWHCTRLFVLFMYLFYFQKNRNLVFRHGALCKRFISVFSFETVKNILNKYKYCEQTLFCLFVTHRVYIKIYRRSNCLAMNRLGVVSWYHRYDGQNCIVVASTPESYAIILPH